MTERKTIAIDTVQTKEWIADAINSRKADDFIAQHGQIVRNYCGSIHGADRKGVIDIEFADMHSAAAFVTTLVLQEATTIRDMKDKPFSGSVVIQVHMSEMPV